MPSGQSVVIINVETQKVYKYSLAAVERDRLTSLLELNRAARSVFPESSMIIDVNKIFTFPLLDQPLLPDEAYQNAKWFVGSVHEAVNELHDTFNLAHLDLRLGNICFTVGTGTQPRVAKLIDLDRAGTVDEPFYYSKLSALYSNSIMYKVKGEDWTLCQLDWRQFGIMVFGFLNNITGDSYHSREPNPNSSFLKKLVENGVYDPVLFTSWDPNVDTV